MADLGERLVGEQLGVEPGQLRGAAPPRTSTTSGGRVALPPVKATAPSRATLKLPPV